MEKIGDNYYPFINLPLPYAYGALRPYRRQTMHSTTAGTFSLCRQPKRPKKTPAFRPSRSKSW